MVRNEQCKRCSLCDCLGPRCRYGQVATRLSSVKSGFLLADNCRSNVKDILCMRLPNSLTSKTAVACLVASCSAVVIAYNADGTGAGEVASPPPSLGMATPAFPASYIFRENFESQADSSNVLRSERDPVGVWFQKSVDDQAVDASAVNWSTEEHAGSGNTNSTTFLDLDDDGDLELRLGFGFDEVRILYNTGIAFDLTKDYKLAGNWAISSSATNHLGFIAGLAEFDQRGNLVQTIGLADDATSVSSRNVFGNTSSSAADGDSGTFSVRVTAGELSRFGITAGHSVGIYFHHDDDGILGSDFQGFRPNTSDVYIVDDISVSTQEPGSEDRRLPNVVMIMADDLGWSEIAAYREQQGLTQVVATPNLDRLAHGGLMFTDAHSPASLCAPTRFSMLTGSSPVRNGLERGTFAFEGDPAVLRNRKHTTVGEVMQRAGYHTAMIGKMHLGGGADFNFNNPQKLEGTFPTSYGFDYSFLVHDGIQAPPYIYFENDEFVRVDPNNESRMDTVGSGSDIVTRANTVDVGPNGTGTRSTRNPRITDRNWNSSQNGIINSDKAVEFIDDHLASRGDQPFLLYYNAPQVHTPHTPPIDFEPDANGNPHSPPRVPVAGSTAAIGGNAHSDVVREFDLQVGKIIAKLEDPNGDGFTDDSILADTLVMVTSDNGGLRIDSGLANYDTTGVLREAKSHSYEGGHRVPFIAHWGDGTVAGSTITPNTVSDQLVAGHDWVPSMYALTGQSVAELDAMDSVNILPVLLGEQDPLRPVRPFLFHQGNKDDRYGIRRGDYVLILNENREAMELYNLKDDLSQTTDLIDPRNYAGDVPRAMLDLASELQALFRSHDGTNEPRSFDPYNADLIFEHDFDAGTAPENAALGSPSPVGIWFLQGAGSVSTTAGSADWGAEVQSNSTSFVDSDASGDADLELRLGFGHDEVQVLYNSGAIVDLTKNYTLSGSWEIAAEFDNHLGFIAGLAEFDSNGNLVQTLGLAAELDLVSSANIFGNTSNNASSGDTGTFSLTVSAADMTAAGVAPGNSVGVYFHRDDDGALGDDVVGLADSVKSDIYIIDDVSLLASD